MPPYCDEHQCYHMYDAETGRTRCQQCESGKASDREVDVHIWCKRETENVRALYTIYRDGRRICYYMPREKALEYLGEFLDELNEEG